MGGSDEPQAIQPAAPPAPPSYGQQIQEYIANYPKLVQLQQDYNPQTAQLDYQMFADYAPKYTQVGQDIQNQLYPQTSKLQETLAGQALEGMSGQLPDWAKQQYQSEFNAGLGMNVNAPIGVSDRNVGLLNLQKSWQDYYRNLGLSVAGRQPLQQTANPSFQNSTQGLQGALGYGAQNYATQMSGYGSQVAGTQYTTGGGGSPWGPLAGMAIGGVAGSFMGQPMAGARLGAGIGGMF